MLYLSWRILLQCRVPGSSWLILPSIWMYISFSIFFLFLFFSFSMNEAISYWIFESIWFSNFLRWSHRYFNCFWSVDSILDSAEDFDSGEIGRFPFNANRAGWFEWTCPYSASSTKRLSINLSFGDVVQHATRQGFFRPDFHGTVPLPVS